jgi:hypothetical protein
MDNEKLQIYDLLYSYVGEGGCGASCTDADIYQENGEWKLFLCGFMAPLPMGKTLAEVEANLREYTRQGFGLGAPV